MVWTHKWAAAAVAFLAVTTGGAPASSAARAPAAPPPLYPAVGPTTHLLDHARLLGDVPEPAWYEANIPFVDLPDADLQATYYYRWRSFKEALKNTGAADGWIVSEFLGPVGYSAPYGGIDAAAGHHIYEGRWLRDRRYVDDYLDYWLSGSGSGPKPATDELNDNATDWAHQYSFWAVDAAVSRAEVTGDWGFLIGRLPQLRRQYEGWKATNFDPSVGLYWQTPVWDAMEYTAGSYQSSDPYHGGAGFRPTINAYQYGDAKALALLLRKAGDPSTAARYDAEADALRANVQKYLWDPTSSFYKHVMRADNPSRAPIADREEIGYIPWYFHLAPDAAASAWAQLTDPQGFAAPYGPTTTERRSPWYMHQALDGCCHWDGPSWPFATSQTLTALANQLIDYPAQPYVDRDDFYAALRGYALTQRKDGRPYVAEAHHPDEDRWIYDSRNHSEDYNHSTFNDIVLSGLLGIRPQPDDSVRISPLAPASWDHFAVESLAYQGHNLSVVWDRDGTVYGQGKGLRVWVDGVLRSARPTLTEVRVGTGSPAAAADQPALVDDAANVTKAGYPTARASYTWGGDQAVNAIDGQDFHLDVPTTRWTTYQSPNASDWLEVDLGAATVVSDVRVDFYDDGGGVRTPTAYALQQQLADGAWRDVPGQQRDPAQPVGRAINRIVVDPPITTDRLRVVASRAGGGAVGITALQLMRRPDPALTATFRGLTGGAVAVDDGRTVKVQTEIKADRLRTGVRATLTVPRGWTARALSPSSAARLRAGATLTTTWQVTVPADADLSSDAPIRVLAAAGAGTSAALVPARYQFSPADYPTTAWDDDFSTDRTAAYRIDRPAAGEPAPAVTVAGGALTAQATSRAFGVLAAPVAGSPAGTAVIVTPKQFAGSAPEDSLFVGQSAGAADNALAWYNNHFKTSGADVRVAGAVRSDAAGGCCASVSWQPGDRFAALVRWGQLTTWVEHDGSWQRIHTAPVTAAVDAGTLASWAPAVGLRLDAGTLSLDRITVLTR